MDSLYNTLFRTRLPLAITSFSTDRFAIEYRTHNLNSILKSVHFLVIFPRASWHDTCRVTVSRMLYSLVVGEDCLYTSTLLSLHLGVEIKVVKLHEMLLVYNPRRVMIGWCTRCTKGKLKWIGNISMCQSRARAARDLLARYRNLHLQGPTL